MVQRFIASAYISIVLLFGTSLTLPALGQPQAYHEATEPHRDINLWFQYLGQLGQSPLLEPASSHGAIGISLGAGMVQAQPQEKASPLHQNETGTPEDLKALPKVWLVKGLTWPVNLGLSAGRHPNAGFSLVSGHIQWTIYEALALPALAIRGSFSRFVGLASTEFRTIGSEALVSYGFLKFFTLYAGVGAYQHQGSLELKASPETAYLLNSDRETQTFEKKWVETSRMAGLKILILPPFVALTGEAQVKKEGEPNYAVKLSIGT